jgi:hypothetical protein
MGNIPWHKGYRTKTKSSTKLHINHTVTQSRNSSTSIEFKLPKIIKLSSSTEKLKLEILYSPNKGSSKVIKTHEDCQNSKNKSWSSSKMPFWGSPDLSPGIEKLFNAMNLCDDSKSHWLFP